MYCHSRQEYYIHQFNCWKLNWCNAMQYITSWNLPWIHLMQQFWPCSSRVVMTWCNPLQHWNQRGSIWCNAMQEITSLNSKLFEYVMFSAPVLISTGGAHNTTKLEGTRFCYSSKGNKGAVFVKGLFLANMPSFRFWGPGISSYDNFLLPG